VTSRLTATALRAERVSRGHLSGHAAVAVLTDAASRRLLGSSRHRSGRPVAAGPPRCRLSARRHTQLSILDRRLRGPR
jgi:hypothetical protein